MVRPAAARAPEFKPRSDSELESLRQELVRAFAARDAVDRQLQRILQQLQLSGGGGGAPVDAEYVTHAANATLTNERRLVNGTNTTVDTSVAGQIAINATGGIAGIDVEDTDESPTVATVTQLRFDSADGFVVSSPGAGIARVDLGSNTVPGDRLADDGVTFAKLQNIATNRILGRDTAGSGNVEELTISAPFAIGNDTPGAFEFSEWSAEAWYANPTGGDAVPVEVTPGPGLVWVGTQLEVSHGSTPDTVLYEVAFSSLANNTFTNGTEVVDGRNWTIANAGNATTFEQLNGSGIHWDMSANNNAFSTAGQTAPYMIATWADILGTDFDPFGTFTLWWRIGSASLATNNNSIRFFVTTASTFSTLGHANRVRPAGTLGYAFGGAGGSGTSVLTAGAYNTADVVVLRVSPNLVTAFVGTWSGGWPAASSLMLVGGNTPGIGANATATSHGDPLARFGAAATTGDVSSAAMDVVLANFKIERNRG